MDFWSIVFFLYLFFAAGSFILILLASFSTADKIPSSKKKHVSPGRRICSFFALLFICAIPILNCIMPLYLICHFDEVVENVASKTMGE